MGGEIVRNAKQNFGGAVAAGTEDTAAYILSLALSPMGLALMGCVLLVAFWKARG